MATRVLVCGATFGRLYLEAFRRPSHEPFDCVGLLARGSDRARACASRYGIPLFTDVADVGDVDIACVVVRSGLLGGQGTELAMELMRRGVHVVQEHPVHHVELADLLRTARRTGVHYLLNSFYVHVKAVRGFVAAALELSRTRRIRYLDASCGLQTAYSTLDILAAVAGRTAPARLDVVPTNATGEPFRILTGTIGGIPLTMRVQHRLDPKEPDEHSFLLHRVTCGTDAGNLTLHDTHGPVLWHDRPDFHDIRASLGTLDDTPDHLRRPPVVTLGESARSYRHVADLDWPDAVLVALRTMAAFVEGRGDPVAHGQGHLALCRLWSGAAASLGPPELAAEPPTAPLTRGELGALADTVAAAQR